MRAKTIALGRSKYSVQYRDDTDESVIYEVLQSQDYKVCEAAIKSAKVMIDIGAHIGTFALYARTLNTEATIYCYEPLLSNYDVLKMNIKENRLKNVFPAQQAVSGTTGEVLLHVSNNNHNNSLQTPYSADTGTTQKVQATTLERIFHKHRIPHCGLLKIDCEGAEYDIFEQTPAEIFQKIDAIFMEYHEHFGRRHTELIKMLEVQGFKKRALQPSRYSKTLGTLFMSR